MKVELTTSMEQSINLKFASEFFPKNKTQLVFDNEELVNLAGTHAVVDPGFSRGGGANLTIFSENSIKIKTTLAEVGEGGPLRP